METACGHTVETVPGISSAQMLASKGRVCFDETTFLTFHRRGDIGPFKRHLIHALEELEETARLWLMTDRLHLRVEVVTFIGESFAHALEKRLEDDGWPVARAIHFDGPGPLARALTNRPDVVQVIDHDGRRALHYGSRAGRLT